MTIQQVFNITGMHCASCAGIIEKSLKELDGIESAEVNYGTESAKILFDNSKIDVEKISEYMKPLGYSLITSTSKARSMNMSSATQTDIDQLKKEKLAEIEDMRMKVITTIPLATVAIFVMTWDIMAQYNILPRMSFVWAEIFHHILPIIATYVLVVIGRPYMLGIYRWIRYGKANMDTLIGIGTFVAFIYSFLLAALETPLRPYVNVEQGYYDVTIIVITFITLGKYLEAQSKLKTGDAIEKLLGLQAKTALVIRDDKEVEIPIDQVTHGEIIIIKPAGKIPVDGIITEGTSYINESMITGESMPVKKNVGDSVIAGTLNTTGVFTIKATMIGAETVLAHIITMVKEAQGSKAPIQALADTISSIFVPIILILAVLTLDGWLLFGTSSLGFAQALSYGLVSSVSILVIACPCALGLATPTAIIVGVGKGAQEGILVKDAATLEKLQKVNIVVVDKTGTITRGKPELISTQNISNRTENEILSILATLENKSEHPIAHAIITSAKKRNLPLEIMKDFEVIKGKGIRGTINGIEYFAGNTALISDLNLSITTQAIEKETNEGKTPIILATKDDVLGIFMVADAIKPEAAQAIRNLHTLGIKTVMLTGDNKNTARYIANQVGIDEIVAEVLPVDKLKKIKELQKEGYIVAMAGDGVNDAPALAQADVGIAMATGTDVAIESAGITLLHGDISKLVKAIRLAKITMRGIKQNLFWAFIYNIAGIPLASGILYPFFGWLLSPVFAGFAMALSSVSVVGNSLRLRIKKL